jgi:pimeloyl-ACP methyl ester carboxylesterase
VDTRYGQVHLAEHGSGDPVLLLHQTPRSWDEYRDVLPLLGTHRRAIALDTLGFGDSARPDEPWTVELFAAGVLAAADALGLTGFDLVGHHTGGVLFDDVVKERFTALTRHTTMSVALLRKQVDRVRLEGIAVEREEVRLGYLSTAVPVFGSRGMLAGALSITGPTSRLNVDRVAGALRTAAAGISRAVAAMSCEAGSEGCISAQCPLPDCGRH